MIPVLSSVTVMNPQHDRVAILDSVRDAVEQIVSMAGIQGNAVHVVRHVLMALFAIVVAWAAELFCRRLLLPAVLKFTAHTEAKWDDVLFSRNVLVSACRIVPAVVIWLLLPLVFYQYHMVEELLSRATAIYITVMTMRLALAFIQAFRSIETGPRQSSAQQYIHSLCGVLKIMVVFIGTVVTVAIAIGRSPLSLLAGLGATSAVMMLVFKDSIVEEMSLTTVKVCNFDNTIVTVSPTTLVADSFQNWKGMQQSGGRRVKRQVYFDFHSIRLADEALKQHMVQRGFFTEKELAGTLINSTLFRRYMEKYLAEQPTVNTQMTLMVRQLEATTTGLPIEFYFFLKDKTWVDYEHQLADIMDAIYALTPEFGMKIYQQYPEQ